MKKRLLIVGGSQEHEIGCHLLRSAQRMNLQCQIMDTLSAQSAIDLKRILFWRLLDHRPANIHRFCKQLLRMVDDWKPHVLLATGIAPIDVETLRSIKKSGVQLLNYLTDDPWNKVLGSRWFKRSLPVYDHIFSVRAANLKDLKLAGCENVSYLPFAYSTDIHYPASDAHDHERQEEEYDIVFVGGADQDRVPYIEALIKKGYRVGLFGQYWNRFATTKKNAGGLINPQQVRQVYNRSKIVLCLVRRSNRDGNVMRTFEVPAMRGCMLAEDTQEHREIFGAEGKAVFYFSGLDEMLKKVKLMLANDTLRASLREQGYQLMKTGNHSYDDRLRVMLEVGFA